MGSNLSRIEKTRIPYFVLCGSFLQKIAHCYSDFLYMRFECEVSGIQELDSRVRVIASEGFSTCGNEIKISLPQMASSGGFHFLKYSWNEGYSFTLLA